MTQINKLLILLILTILLHNIFSESLKNHSLNEYTKYALSNNPLLKSSFYKWKASIDRIPQSKALADPKLSYSYFVNEVETRVGAQTQKLSLSQKLPWFGKLKLKGGIAFEKSEVNRLKYEFLKLEIINNVKNVYLDYYFLGKLISINSQNLVLLKQQEELLSIKYSTASTSHANLIRIQIERIKLENTLLTLKKKQKVLNLDLVYFLNAPKESILPIPDTIRTSNLLLSETEFVSKLLKENYNIKILEKKLSSIEKTLNLSKKNYFPDFSFGLNYIVTNKTEMTVIDNGKDPFIINASINLPINFIKRSASVRESTKKKKSLEFKNVELKNKLKNKVSKLYYKLDIADRNITLYKEKLIPMSLQALNALDIQFRTGKTEFTEYINALRLLLEFKIKYQESIVNRELVLANLNTLIE